MSNEATLSGSDSYTTSNNFYQNVLNWAQQRNIVKGAKAKRQRTKTWEELTEVATGIAKSNISAEKLELVKDAIGDCAVTTANVINCMLLDSVRIGQEATEIVQARGDIFKTLDVDDLLNMFITHQAIVKTGEDDKSHAFLPFVVNYPDQLAISLAALEVLATRLGLTFTECQDFAWNEIKDRKGMMVNGTFIKEADVETTLNAVVSTALDDALEVYGAQFADDQVGTTNTVWNTVVELVRKAVGDTLDLDESAMGIDAEKATVTATIVVQAFQQFTLTAERTVVELKSEADESADASE